MYIKRFFLQFINLLLSGFLLQAGFLLQGCMATSPGTSFERVLETVPETVPETSLDRSQKNTDIPAPTDGMAPADKFPLMPMVDLNKTDTHLTKTERAAISAHMARLLLIHKNHTPIKTRYQNRLTYMKHLTKSHQLNRAKPIK